MLCFDLGINGNERKEKEKVSFEARKIFCLFISSIKSKNQTGNAC